MINCFENYIGLEGLSPEISPRSGLYVNKLPGVTIGMFSALQNEDQDSALEYWETVYQRGVNNFIDHVAGRIDKTFHVEKVIESKLSGEFDKPFLINNAAATEAGVEITLITSKYSLTEVQRIKIYSIDTPSPSTTTLSIIDNETEAVLWSKEIDLEEGLNVIDVFESFESEKIRVVYSPLAVQSYTTSLITRPHKGCYSCFNGSSTVTQLNGGGLVVEFQTKCSVEAFICSQLSRFKNAFWYWLGVELMTDAIMSRNTNCFTIDREQAQQNLGFYEGEVEKKLDLALNNLKIKDDVLCFECKGSVSRATILP